MKTAHGVVALLLLLAIAASPAGAEDGPPRLGEDSPPLNGITWILGDNATSSASPGGVTVLEFWATWCPVSRIVLARQDSLQTVLGDRATFVAVTREDAAAVRRFLADAGWRHLRIGCDTTGAVTHTFLVTPPGTEALDPHMLPYAYILDGGKRDRGRAILWMGSVADPEAEDPLAAFETALHEILSGTYDLAHAKEVRRQEARSVELFNASADAIKADDLDGIAKFLDGITGIRLARGYRNTFAGNMNSLAWGLVTHEGRTPRHIELARRACEMGLRAGGEKDPGLLDTYARVLYEMGDVKKALEFQGRAVELGKESGFYAELRKTLDLYREKLGLPPEPESEEEIEPKEEPGTAPAWSGTLNDVWKTFDKARMVVVRPSPSTDAAREAAWASQIGKQHEAFFKGSRIRLPAEVSPEERKNAVLVLYGAPTADSLTAEILEHHGITIAADGVRVGGRRLAAENPVLITCVPNPWNPALPAVIYTAYAEKDDLGLNVFYHGPTALVLGRWNAGKPEVLHSMNYLPANGPDGNPALSLAIGTPVLDTDAALEDLRRLDELLTSGYAGYADLDWKLQVHGSSWAKRTAEFEQRIQGQESLTWSAFFDLLRDYLEPIEDTHFAMTGAGTEGREVIERQASFVHRLVPFFSDLRIEARDGAFVVAEAPESTGGIVGEAIVDVPVAASPHAVQAGVPYLFPTLPASPRPSEAKAAKRFLLGVLAEDDPPPSTLTVKVRPVAPASSPGTVREAGAGPGRDVQLPLHRGRSARRRRGGSKWGLVSPPKSPITVLVVRTMNQKQLDGMPETADALRDLSRLVLDLRGNGGGSDTPAIQWCQRFSGQPYEWVAHVGHWPGRSDPLRAWMSFPGRTLLQVVGPSAASAPAPYRGRLYVLVDKNVYSSGETFTQLAGQVPGALLVGENTAGCVSYGNVEEHEPLPHSRIQVAFGRTRFVEDWVRPNREGVGFFPDYWLDADDPVAVIAAYAERRGG